MYLFTMGYTMTKSRKDNLNRNKVSNKTNNRLNRKKRNINATTTNTDYQTISKKGRKQNVKKKAKNKLKQMLKNKTNDVKESNKNQKSQLKTDAVKTLLNRNQCGSLNEGKKTLRERMLEQLKASRFRYLNEQLYTSKGNDALNLFKSDPESFRAYHEGYRQQIAKWPLNPIDTIIKSVKKLPSNYVVADLGCGDAKLAQSVKQKVHSFDLIANNELITVCDMAHCPLPNCSIDVVVFCLSLMGTNLEDFLTEANRMLKIGGILKIAEVESRFEGADIFIKGLTYYGFKNTFQDLSHNLFYFLDFKKERNIKKKNKLPTISLHPCLYKKR